MKLELLIELWLRLSLASYFIGWISSIVFFDISLMAGMGVGVLTWIMHMVILQILYWINGDGWMWKP